MNSPRESSPAAGGERDEYIRLAKGDRQVQLRQVDVTVQKIIQIFEVCCTLD